jgi:uncharacterized protein with NRDE domain
VHGGEPTIYAKDLKAGGTFLGLNVHSGAFAAITNVANDGESANVKSRGLLVLSRFTDGCEDPMSADYEHFNLWHGHLFSRPRCAGVAPLTCSRVP